MTPRAAPRVLSIPPGAPFLPTLAQALVSGRLIPGFAPREGAAADPLALEAATIFVPTRRAARELRGVLVELSGGSAILPTIRPLGEFDDDEAAFDTRDPSAMDLPPPIPDLDRLLLLARLARAWKRRLPADVAARFDEDVVVPASASDAVWLARDLARLMDEIETEGADWAKLSGLVPGDLAGWWQVTLDFLRIVTLNWPEILAGRGQSNPAAHRDAMIRLEAERIARRPPGPVVAAGSTGSIPATAELLSVIARLPQGAVVLPGLDLGMDARAWNVLAAPQPHPSVLGHPQYGLARLLGRIGLSRDEVQPVLPADSALSLRASLVAEALRPAETTDEWADRRSAFADDDLSGALAGVSIVEAANEREESAAIAVALRLAVEQDGRRAALVTGDRGLARRVSAELLRFGIRADDSGGRPLLGTPPGELLALLLRCAFKPGDPLPIIALLKHPLMRLGLDRARLRRAAETLELVALRGGTGRPDAAALESLLERSLAGLASRRRAPSWTARLSAQRLEEARDVASRLAAALSPLAGLRPGRALPLASLVRATVQALEELGRDTSGDLGELYSGDAGEKIAEALRRLVAAEADFEVDAGDWPDVVDALLAPEIVKPAPGSDPRISIWGTLEARLQSVDTLVIGGLNEGTWPGRPQPDRFMSRLMKTGIDLLPPERRIGQAAHDFVMAMGSSQVVLTRSARAGDSPAVPSRWLQRLLTFAGQSQADRLRRRGARLAAWGRALDDGPADRLAPRPEPAPPLAVRPTRFSVTEIETLRRDPYAVYARRVLGLEALDPLLRDPGAAERGTLFHEILHRFSATGVDPRDPAARDLLLAVGRECFAQAALPADVAAIWWPRFVALSQGIVEWERNRAASVVSRHPELRAGPLAVGASGVTLSGYADRIDVTAGGGMADIVDFKTGSSPSKAQAHTLLSPQLALEGALLMRGAFADLGPLQPADLAFVRLKADGRVEHESILQLQASRKSAAAMSDEAWERLGRLLAHYADPANGYKSRALPFREGDTDGDYDHLARVLEWSAGGESPEEGLLL